MQNEDFVHAFSKIGERGWRMLRAIFFAPARIENGYEVVSTPDHEKFQSDGALIINKL